ncbi:UNVERIFIED_CONTAM: hypothetical protein GTU68_000620 [Idotea baltica]|nr:hypothetical protein [Idotea baltica]
MSRVAHCSMVLLKGLTSSLVQISLRAVHKKFSLVLQTPCVTIQILESRLKRTLITKVVRMRTCSYPSVGQ